MRRVTVDIFHQILLFLRNIKEKRFVKNIIIQLIAKLKKFAALVLREKKIVKVN